MEFRTLSSVITSKIDSEMAPEESDVWTTRPLERLLFRHVVKLLWSMIQLIPSELDLALVLRYKGGLENTLRSRL